MLFISIFNNYHKENVIHRVSKEGGNIYSCECGLEIPKNHLFHKVMIQAEAVSYKNNLIVCECADLDNNN